MLNASSPEAVGSPSLETFKSHLDVVLVALLEQGVGPGGLQRSLQPQPPRDARRGDGFGQVSLGLLRAGFP